MQKKSFKSIALLGLSAGLLVSQLAFAEETKANASVENANEGNLGYHLMSEEELLGELNDEGTKVYNNLSPEGKALALRVASARCNGTNECSGLNSCKTDKNECMGQGKCRGQSKCAIADKNMAVKLVSNKMANKRQEALD